jgi:hypothetical protein
MDRMLPAMLLLLRAEQACRHSRQGLLNRAAACMSGAGRLGAQIAHYALPQHASAARRPGGYLKPFSEKPWLLVLR